MAEQLAGADEQFRRKVLVAQGQYRELKPLLEAANRLLVATHRDSVSDAEEVAKRLPVEPRRRSFREGSAHYESEHLGARNAGDCDAGR